MDQNNLQIFKKEWFLTAGETDARGLMPITLVAERAIELATDHANALGIGYADLVRHRIGWVLARLSIEMVRYPGINEWYNMETWIESYNRRFSERCFVMRAADGAPVAYVRSVWVGIDMDTRTMADLSRVETQVYPVAHLQCPAPATRTPALDRDARPEREEYTFRYCDIDFNRHVNTIRYLDVVLNRHSLDYWDAHNVQRLVASFDHECYYGEEAQLLSGPDSRTEGAEVTEFHVRGRRAVAVSLDCVPR